jgi:uncharacterized protein (TIGR02246 family)
MKLAVLRARRFVLALMVLASAVVSAATAADKPPAEAEKVVRDILTAFENLDYDGFLANFATDATMFFPPPEPPQRFDGREAIGAHFRGVFAKVRQQSQRQEPPYQKFDPESLHWQVLSPEVVIATFHLRNEVRLARRTLVLQRREGRWLVAHLHASNVPRP